MSFKDKQKLRTYQNAWLREKQKDPEWAAKRAEQKRSLKKRKIPGISRGMRIMKFDAFDISQDMVICVATWNRPKITKLCLDRLYATKARALLYILDDGSTEDTSFLEAYADKVFRQPHGQGGSQGVAENRIKLTSEALKTGREFIYHTDSDILHDPEWLPRLGYMSNQWEDHYIYSLFNSQYHAVRGFSTSSQQMDHAKVCRRIEAPGASLMVRASVLTKHPYEITPERVKQTGAWDHCWSTYLDGGEQRCLISLDSFVDHFPSEGDIHGLVDDLPLNRTQFLLDERPATLGLLKKKNKS